jgi:hypothetical protein
LPLKKELVFEKKRGVSKKIAGTSKKMQFSGEAGLSGKRKGSARQRAARSASFLERKRKVEREREKRLSQLVVLLPYGTNCTLCM